LKKHLKRYSAPKHWKLGTKTAAFAVRPSPGPHAIGESIPLLNIVRDFLGYATNAREAKKIVEAGEILVDHQPRKSLKYGAGLMDVVTIPKTDENFRIVPGEKGPMMPPIPTSKADAKLVRVMGKSTLKGGKLQLNLHDGSNLEIPGSDSGKYSVGDTLEMTIRARKVKDVLKIKPGNMAYIHKGKNMGQIGTIKERIEGKAMQSDSVILSVDGNEVRTLEDYIFVIGKKKPKIKVD
jgi:small subunit ribosomal protein S4e